MELRPGIIISALQVKALVLSPGCTLEAPESPEETLQTTDTSRV